MSFVINGEIIYKREHYSAEELRQQVRSAELWLNQYTMCKDRPVALLMNRTPKLLTVIFALLGQKIPFLQLDEQMPMNRLDYMLKSAQVEYVVSDVLTIDTFCECKVLDFNNRQESAVTEMATNKPSELAYLLFTSGTTGYPKAVEVYRKGLINFIDAIPKCVRFPENTRIACTTNATFDIFFLESVMALCHGMTVVLADDKERSNPRMLRDIILNDEVNTLQMTPSMLFMLQMADADLDFLKGIDVLMLGGEQFPERMLKKLQGVVRGRIYNMYGPTETTIWSAVADLTEAEEVTIGSPIQNTEIFIVEDERILADGEEGEIVIAGDGLARGYCNNPEKTAQNFMMLDCKGTLKRVYKTGDLGYFTEKKTLICKGRKDLQVKILGHRIELGDVEENIRRINGIDNAAVATYGEDIKRLICFYIGDSQKSEEMLETEARKYLPVYMIPDKWVCVSAILYTASGKADRNAMINQYMPNMEDEREAKEEELSEDEQKLAEYFSLKGKTFDLNARVKDMVSDSIEYIEFMVYLEECLDIDMEDEVLSSDYFETMRDIAAYCKKAKEE